MYKTTEFTEHTEQKRRILWTQIHTSMRFLKY